MTEEENGKTEVVVKAKRRQHSAEYKLRILQELDACSGKGEIGAVLRRERLYSSLVSKWREQREKGSLNGLSGQKRGPKVDPNTAELARLQRENKRLKEQLERAELIIEVKKRSRQADGRDTSPVKRGELMKSAEELSKRVGKREACAVLGIPRSRLYRTEKPRSATRTSPRALSQREPSSRASGTEQRAFSGLCPAGSVCHLAG